MNALENYRDRYCAFVDILGFRRLIEQLNGDGGSFDALHNLLKRIHATNSGEAVDVHDTDFRAQSISDAVAISTSVSAIGLYQLFKSLQRLALDLLSAGYFVRGAVVRAPLFHDDQTVFGEALVRAYHFESEVAKFPRIIVVKEVRDDIIAYTAASRGVGIYPKMEILRHSADGPMYLNVLQPVVDLLRDADNPYNAPNQSEPSYQSRCLRIRDKIQQRYGEAMDDPRHFEKVKWFARYWNDVIPKKHNLTISAAEREF